MKNLLFAAILLSGSAMGQMRTDTITYQAERVIVTTDSATITPVSQKKEHYLFNGFWDNWYVNPMAGGQVYYGAEDWKKSFGKRIVGTYEISFGKWIHPAFGLRAKVGGGLFKGYSTGTLPVIPPGFNTGTPDANGLYEQRWHAVYVEVDFMVDLTNAIWGYNRERIYSAIPFAGGGIAIALNQPKYNGDRSGMLTFGLINKIRINKYFDFNVEIKDAIVKQEFDREEAEKDFEHFVALTGGFTFRFGNPGNRKFRRGSGASSTMVTKTIQHMPIIPARDTTTAVAPVEKEVIRETIVEKKRFLAHPLAVFFELNKADIADRSKVNLAFVADIIKSSGGARFLLVGSADSKTASAKYNQALSTRRSKAVRDYLVRVLLVDPNQLVLDPIGGIDRYSPAKVNRAVIIRQEQVQ